MVGVMARGALTIASLATTLLVAAGASGTTRPTGVFLGCHSGSGAAFWEHAFTSRDNLVVGPLVMVGAGRFTTADTVRQFGGNKFPLLVATGHRVTIELTRRARRAVSLGYGHIHEGEVTWNEGRRVMTFRSCDWRNGDSDARGRRTSFWSGFVMASGPRCVHLRVWVDDEPAPRRAHIELGLPCR